MERDYPWTSAPLVAGAPMRLIALASLAVEVSAAGGIGFIGAGSDLDSLDSHLEQAAALIASHPKLQECRDQRGILPVGFGTLNWGADINLAIAAVKKWVPAAIWLFGAHNNTDYVTWIDGVRAASHQKTKIWIQIGTVADAVEIAQKCKPDVLIVQGADAGGHGLEAGASLMTLLPEVVDALDTAGIENIPLVAAGGIIDGRGVAASFALGAAGVSLGTRLLASEEATITNGYRNEVVRSSDGGVNTVRTKVYDQLRGTNQWPKRYNARTVINQSFHDHTSGLTFEENKMMYDAAMQQGDSGWGVNGRLATYAGSGVGLVKKVMKAGDIVREVQTQSRQTGTKVASLR